MIDIDLPSKIGACWLGKAVGGTLGTPHEGKAGPLGLSFYDPVPTDILPNDDLDLQLVWLHHLQATGAREVTPAVLADAWCKHVEFPFDEYSVCKRNAAYGLRDERLGAVDNWFGECMGAAIRSELWACLAPGQPERAAGFAWNDAACDHSGEGVWAEIFFAALEAAAFVEHDRDRLLDLALGFLPSSSRVHRAVTDTRRWWQKSGQWRQVREEIMGAYAEANFTDVAVNVAFTVLGWLAGENDFGRSILIATNCGEDTDCTAATLGSILGIIDPGCIPATWKAPIGERIVLSREIVGMEPPPTLTDLTTRTLELQRQLADARPVIGRVLPRRPATPEQWPIRVPVRVAWSEDRASLSRETPPAPGEFGEEIVLPGHWLQRGAADFAAPVQWIHCRMRLETPTAVRLSAWSQQPTAVWVDGRKVAEQGLRDSRLSGPSFHRGGGGHFDPPGVLAAGEHDFVVAWEAPGTQADLVLGAADFSSKQWLPWALAR